MRRRNVLPESPQTASPKLNLYRLPFVDGCYDEGGAYWGAPADIYRAAGEDTEIFVRAASRDEAKHQVHEQLPNARFYR